MIKFFQKIRQNMIKESKVSKYLLYAIGEIILVVIGILIALQVNNWNEYRKDRISEKELYLTLIESLESDLEDVQDKIIIIDSAIIAQEIFITKSLNEVETKYTTAELSDLIWKVAYTSYSFFPNYSLYNKISNNKQIDLIQSKRTQMEIMELYEQHYKEYNDLDLNLEQKAQFSLIPNYFGNMSSMYIESQEMNIDLFRENYSILTKECREIYFLSVTTKNSMRNCQDRIESLLEVLDNELNSL